MPRVVTAAGSMIHHRCLVTMPRTFPKVSLRSASAKGIWAGNCHPSYQLLCKQAQAPLPLIGECCGSPLSLFVSGNHGNEV